ncbi:hypothetical protein STXM2123_489 [Streptomyces sp. F-3]|nr:hypothetical protein STXM2123_489 [Streptomyces sp. F-3]
MCAYTAHDEPAVSRKEPAPWGGPAVHGGLPHRTSRSEDLAVRVDQKMRRS